MCGIVKLHGLQRTLEEVLIQSKLSGLSALMTPSGCFQTSGKENRVPFCGLGLDNLENLSGPRYLKWLSGTSPRVPFCGLGLDNHPEFIWSQISEMALWD